LTKSREVLELFDILPENEQNLAYEFIKRIDSDYTNHDRHLDNTMSSVILPYVAKGYKLTNLSNTIKKPTLTATDTPTLPKPWGILKTHRRI